MENAHRTDGVWHTRNCISWSISFKSDYIIIIISSFLYYLAFTTHFLLFAIRQFGCGYSHRCNRTRCLFWFSSALLVLFSNVLTFVFCDLIYICYSFLNNLATSFTHNNNNNINGSKRCCTCNRVCEGRRDTHFCIANEISSVYNLFLHILQLQLACVPIKLTSLFERCPGSIFAFICFDCRAANIISLVRNCEKQLHSHT